MTPADTLAAHGIRRAPEVVELAAAAHLDLACAAVLLVKESGGGRNLWGSDPVPTAGCYNKGTPVVRGDYLAYLGAVARGTAGRQGVGPCQLTAKVYQDQADRAGGCWDWRANCLTGFRALAALIAQHGEEGGFRRYNGSGAAAERYADDAIARLRQWRGWLAGSDTDRPTIRRGDTGPAVKHLQRLLGVAGPGDPGYGTFGPQTEAAVRKYQAAHGLAVDGVVGPATWREMGGA